MNHRRPLSLFTSLLMIATSLSLPAAPEDHLAPAPQASKMEAEVIALLEISQPVFSATGEVIMRVYNPTKYVLKSCVVRVEIPSKKINRIYTSNPTSIAPNKDGEFSIKTAIFNTDSQQAKVEILKLDYEPARK